MFRALLFLYLDFVNFLSATVSLAIAVVVLTRFCGRFCHFLTVEEL